MRGQMPGRGAANQQGPPGQNIEISVSRNSTRCKREVRIQRLRRVSCTSPLRFLTIAKKCVLMPDGDSNALFCSIGIASVGTCPPLAMNFKTHFFDSLQKLPPAQGGVFYLMVRNDYSTSCKAA